MNWWLFGGGTIAVIAAVAAAYFLGLAGVLKMVRAFFGLLGDSAHDLREWLKKPGNKLRGLSGLLAIGFVAAGGLAWHRGNIIERERVLSTQRYADLQETAAETEARLRDDLEEKDLAIATFTLLAEKQKELIDKAQAASKEAVEQAYKDGVKAAESNAKYQAEFKKKPPECEAALSVMAKACQTLKDY